MKIQFPEDQLKSLETWDLRLSVDNGQYLDVVSYKDEKEETKWLVGFAGLNHRERFIAGLDSKKEALEWIDENLEIRMVRTVVKKQSI